MKRVAALASLASLALAASSVIAVAGPAHAAACDFGEDLTNPTYVSSSVSPNAVVIGKVKRTIKVTVSARDTCGIDPELLFVKLTPKGNTSGIGIALFGNFTLTSGSVTNGTWSTTQVLEDYQPGGTYVASEVDVYDINVNGVTKINASGYVTVRHATATKLNKPAKSVKKNKKVTLKGSIKVYGAFDPTTTLKVQTKSGSKWKTIKSIKSNILGTYSTKIKVTKTKTYRVVHLQDGVSTGSVSKSYKVKKK